MRILSSLVVASAMVLAVPAAAAWQEARSKHFIIYADLEPSEVRSFGERLERFDQAVRMLRAMEDPPLTDSQRLTIFALKNEASVARLLGSSDAFGFYTTGAAGSFAFVPRKAGFASRRTLLTPENVFFHEYAHHLQLNRIAVALPAWATEGFAEFFATTEMMDNGDVRVGAPPQYREWSVQRYSGLPMAEMLAGSLRDATYREVEAIYGRGWALTHMLTFDTGRRGQMTRYIGAMQEGVEPLQAAKGAFGDDLRALERDLDQYLRQTRFNTLVIDGDALPTGPVTVRPLAPGEAAIMEVRMRLRRGIGRKDADDLAATARKVAADHPNDAVVQLALGQAEFEAGNYAAAEAAGQRAVMADAKSGDALILVARAKMELARQSSASADWGGIRSLLARANRLDTEDAEPLMLFYRTYLHAGQGPTANAIEGLRYAVLLAPQDVTLRIDAVRQHVIDNQLKEASRLFSPVAYDPHSELDWRETKTRIMDALTQSDRTAALALLDAEQKKRWSKEQGD